MPWLDPSSLDRTWCPGTVPGMNKTVIALVAALAGSIGTWAILHNNEEPPASPAKATGLTGSNAKVRALENEVAQLRDQLAKQKKESAQDSPGVKESAAAVRDIAARAVASERDEMVKRRREAMEKRVEEKLARLTTKLNLTPEQAQSTKEWQRSFLEAQLAASLKSPRDPRDYHLGTAYRQDLPPAVQATLSPEQLAVWQNHDQDARADSVETITNGEMGYISRTLDLTREQKDQIFPHLSQLYLEDTSKDFSNVVDLPSLSAQKDDDNDRRRAFYGSILTPEQMQKWETIATEFKASLLQQYSPPAPAPAAP
jgi:small-conductance mechanosensitive channel